MNSLSYQQFIDEINKGKIVKALFQVKDYARYRFCSIEVFTSADSKIRIDVKLGKDYYVDQYGYIQGHFGFFDKFDEKRKLFKMGSKGSFTLKQMWVKIEIISIDYAS